MKKKILLVSPLPPPIGGIATWTKNVLPFFENNPEFEFIHLNSAARRSKITEDSEFVRIFNGTIEMIRTIHATRKIVNKDRPDVVHLISSASFGLVRDFILLGELHKLKTKTVIHFRFGRIPELAIKNNWEWKLICKVISKAERAIVIDKISYETLINHSFKNIEYLPNPVAKDIENIERNRFSCFYERQKGTVLFVGRIIPDKGVLELVKACVDMESVLNLILVGPSDKSTEYTLKSIASRRDNGNWLKFEGPQEKESVLMKMRKCNVFTLPSYTEGFPNVLLESMITACPIVATSVGAIEDMLNVYDSEPAGICIKPKNVEALKNSIETLLNDSALAERFGNSAKQRVLKEYTTKIILDRMISIWLSL